VEPGEIEHVADVRNHWWWRPGWAPGRHFYACHLTLEDQPAVQQLVLDYQAALAGLRSLDLIPSRWLHLTMQGIGFTDEISEREIEAITDTLREHFRTITPPVITFHQPAVWPDAITLPADPASALRQLRQGAYEVIQAVLGQNRMHEPPETIAQYRPHVSVAYISAPGPAQPIVSALRGARPGPVTTALDRASVLTFHRDNRMYEWTAATDLPIGQDSQRAATH
jgi:2'-5' RNA ligase superfamily